MFSLYIILYKIQASWRKGLAPVTVISTYLFSFSYYSLAVVVPLIWLFWSCPPWSFLSVSWTPATQSQESIRHFCFSNVAHLLSYFLSPCAHSHLFWAYLIQDLSWTVNMYRSVVRFPRLYMLFVEQYSAYLTDLIFVSVFLLIRDNIEEHGNLLLVIQIIEGCVRFPTHHHFMTFINCAFTVKGMSMDE